MQEKSGVVGDQLRFKWVVVVICATIIMNFMGGGIDFVFRDTEIIEKRLSTTYTQIGILLATISALGAVVQGPFGRLSDIYGRRKFIICWTISSVVFTCYAFFAYSLLSLYAIGIPRTIVFYLAWIAVLAWVADEVATKDRGKILSILNMGSMIGVVLGPVFLGSLNDFFGLNTAFIIGSAICFALTFPLVFLPEPSGFEPRAAKGGGLRGFREIIRDAPLFILSFSSLLVYAIGAIMMFIMVPFLEIHYNLSLTEVATIIMIMGGFTGVGFILSGFFMDKWVGMRKRLVVLFLAFCGIFLALGPFILPFSISILMAILPIQGFILGVLFPAFLVLMADYAPKGEAGTELGTFQAISTLGFVLGNSLAGYLWDTGFVVQETFGGLSFSLWACAALAFIPIPLIMFKIQERKAL